MKTTIVPVFLACGLLKPCARAGEVRAVQTAPPPIIHIAEQSIEGLWRSKTYPEATLQISKQGQDYIVRLLGNFTGGVFAGRMENGRIFLGNPLGYLTVVGDTIYVAGDEFFQVQVVQAPPPSQPAPLPQRTPALGGVMTITWAEYGSERANLSCNATEPIANVCNGREVCTVFPSNELCGDPAGGKDKQMGINYTCNGVEHAQVGDEHQKMELSCRADWDILHR